MYSGCAFLTDPQWVLVIEGIIPIRTTSPTGWRQLLQERTLNLPHTQLNLQCTPRWRNAATVHEVVRSVGVACGPVYGAVPGLPQHELVKRSDVALVGGLEG